MHNSISKNLIVRKLKDPQKIYSMIVSISGIILFVLLNHFALLSMNLSEWITFYALIGSIIVLYYFTFRLPPEGNSQSMDSAVFLAGIFLYGLGLTLYVLLFSSIIYAFIDRKTLWWKHVLNFAIYSLMIASASIVFVLLGGQIGALNHMALLPYIVSLSVYFTVNIALVGGYFLIGMKGSFFNVFKGLLKETLVAYLSTLILSLVLLILIYSNGMFGLFLFICVAVLLSHAFKQLFVLYKDLSDKVIRDGQTGLYTHGYFKSNLEESFLRAKQESTPLSLVLLDLDNFKKYNDAFGHYRGDQLLEFVGQLLRKECEADEIVAARYGGEEFALIISGMSENAAYHYVNNLRKKVNDTYFEGVEVFPHGCLSFSAGIAGNREEVYDMSQLMNNADQALHYAKTQGKNAVQLFNSRTYIKRSLDIEQDIQEIEQQLRIFLTKDVYTFQHSKRVYRYAAEMAEKLALDDHEKKTLILGALFHDIGKLEIPRDILTKKGKLTQEEWEIVKKHVLWGKEFVSLNPKFRGLIPLVELHHEKYDGTGYPHGLAGGEIPKLARILTIIDSFDAMTTERPYQKTKSFDEAFEELRAWSGKQFDSEFVEPFIEMIKRLQ